MIILPISGPDTPGPACYIHGYQPCQPFIWSLERRFGFLLPDPNESSMSYYGDCHIPDRIIGLWAYLGGAIDVTSRNSVH